jgi:hypothetical protein
MNAFQGLAGSMYVAARSIRLSASRRSLSLRLQAQFAPQLPLHPQVCPQEWLACRACPVVLCSLSVFFMVSPFFNRVVWLSAACRWSDCAMKGRNYLSVLINIISLF